jgi:putative glutamine amidotransferase
VKDIGKGLIPFAYAQDGIVEGIYLRDYAFLVGVQWHPERKDNTFSDAVFSSFILECHEHT